MKEYKFTKAIIIIKRRDYYKKRKGKLKVPINNSKDLFKHSFPNDNTK